MGKRRDGRTDWRPVARSDPTVVGRKGLRAFEPVHHQQAGGEKAILFVSKARVEPVKTYTHTLLAKLAEIHPETPSVITGSWTH